MDELEMFEVITRLDSKDGTRVEILQFKELQGSSDLKTAESLYFANQSDVRLKMDHIGLTNSHIRV